MYEFLSKMDNAINKKKGNKNNKNHHNNHHYNNYNGGYRGDKNVNLKQLLKPKTIKKLGAEEYMEVLDSSMGYFLKELKNFFNSGKSKHFDEESLVDILTNKKFAKILCKLCEDNENGVPDIILYTISQLYLDNNKAFSDDKGVQKAYLKLFASEKEKENKRIAKIMDIKKIDALKLLIICQSADGVKNKGSRNRYHKILSALYNNFNSDDVSEKDIKKIITCAIGKKKIREFVTTILLEYKSNCKNFEPNQKEVWHKMTTFALDYLEKMDNDDRKDLLKFYAKARKSKPEIMRRVSLVDGINASDYKKTLKTVNKLIHNGLPMELFK